MGKPKMRSMKVRMWDGTSTAPKDKDGNPVKFEEFDVRYNACLAFEKDKK